MAYSVREFSEAYRDSYDEFARKNFGKHSYQRSAEYIDWLYFGNPFGRGYADFLIVVDERDQVLGCIHKLRYEMIDSRTSKPVGCSSIHNLMVDSEQRTGAGFLLLKEILRTERHFIVPGVTGKLAESYKSIGAKKLPAWLGVRKLWPNPVRFLERLRGKPLSKSDLQLGTELKAKHGIELESDYSPDLCALLNSRSENMIFSEPFLKWRLFQENRISTLSLWSAGRKSVVLLTIGKRRGVPVGRMLFSFFDNASDGRKLLEGSFRLFRSLGCPVALMTSSAEGVGDIAGSLGVQSRSGVDSLFYSKSIALSDSLFWPMVSDLGFEERFAV